jgi:hypothetical protein
MPYLVVALILMSRQDKNLRERGELVPESVVETNTWDLGSLKDKVGLCEEPGNCFCSMTECLHETWLIGGQVQILGNQPGSPNGF